MNFDPFFPLDFFLRRGQDGPCPQEAADATGLTIICDEDAVHTGDCWYGTQLRPDQAAAAYKAIGGTVSTVYWPGADSMYVRYAPGHETEEDED